MPDEIPPAQQTFDEHVMHSDLTVRQSSILQWITLYYNAKQIMPTLREIGEAFGMVGQGSVKDHLKRIAKKGYLVLGTWHRKRSMQIVEAKLPGAVVRPTGSKVTVSHVRRKMTPDEADTFALALVNAAKMARQYRRRPVFAVPPIDKDGTSPSLEPIDWEAFQQERKAD